MVLLEEGEVPQPQLPAPYAAGKRTDQTWRAGDAKAGDDAREQVQVAPYAGTTAQQRHALCVRV
jgi:hypothetical protein